MSADNCVVIARFPKGKGFEWKVAHVQAIENCDDSNINPDGSIEYWPKDYIDANRVMYFRKALSFSNEKEAHAAAKKIYDEIMDECGIIEYGIIPITYDRPLKNWTKEQAVKVIDKFWESRGKAEEKNG